MAPPSPALPPPPELLEELISEILLRLPPEEPAHLLRASLVCSTWRRLISYPAFRRQYREHHRTPPLLGFLHNLYDEGPIPLFVAATASPCSSPALHCRSWWALDSRHGRVLIHSFGPSDLVVWDPITGDQQHLPVPAYPHTYYTAAVLCAVAGCDHLDCHGGPFLVVFVGTDDEDEEVVTAITWASVYASETGAWSSSTSVELDSYVETWPSLFTGDALYFMLEQGQSILRYDVVGRGLSEIEAPEVDEEMGIAVKAEDGGLGFACVEDGSLCLWSWQEAGADGTAGWVQQRVIKLTTLLPIRDISVSLGMVGFAESIDTIFVSTEVGIFALKLRSGQVRKVGEEGAYSAILPSYLT